ncbi:HTH CENPB-type domain-containing protein [Trichonephila clavipes]|uniref:HTH CENPB-type domain-containing protein n=1 Tax=Trichonephila clavipes TaxID=2585209 RepID=A0A8X6SPK5_TRICX|nr:HTH CENPB-type domain-containing protein [Trichonephila clavipes]
MTGDLFKNWIHQLDAIFGKQKRKVILFVDNCPAHPKDIPTTNIKIVFLPPTATSKLQPLDQDEPNTTDNIISNITETEEILQNFPDYAAVDDALITSSTRTLGDIIAYSLSLTTSDPVGSEREKSDSEEEDDHLPTPSVSAGLQIVGELKKLISTMENAEDMLTYVNRIDNFLSTHATKNLKQSTLDRFLSGQ